MRIVLAVNHSADVARIFTTTRVLHELMRAVAEVQLPQGCLAAGVVRNAVWDVLHGRVPGLHPESDVDLIYFDPSRLAAEHDAELEASLRARCPGVAWQVRNQARMHVRNGDAPYRSCHDALRFFPEVATAVSACLSEGRVVIDAPFGLSDLFALIVRPTPHFSRKPEVYRARLATKDWAQRWPQLRFLEA